MSITSVIAAALKQAMNDYTARDKKNYGDTDVSKAAYPKFLEKALYLQRFVSTDSVMRNS